MFPFEIFINDVLLSVNPETGLTPIDRKRVLSLGIGFNDGKWWKSKLINFVWDNISETALSAKDRLALFDSPGTNLARSAASLRLTDSVKDPGRGSEIAEIILYGIMRHHYGALPDVPKIFYKQNRQDYAKGADSVHIIIEGEDDFSLWFGESKFYSTIFDSNFDIPIGSIREVLTEVKIRRENAIIRGLSDLDDLGISKTLVTKIRELLTLETPLEELKPRMNIPILLLYQCKITKDAVDLSDDYKEKLVAYHSERAEAYFSKQIAELGNDVFNYEKISFHLILIPVPDKAAIVEPFIALADLYRATEEGSNGRF
jgi:hypothetical protein